MLTNFIVENVLQYVLDHYIYTLNLHSAICQLYLNKPGRKKGKDNLIVQEIYWNWSHHIHPLVRKVEKRSIRPIAMLPL